ncbi:CheR family methyltransferase [Chondrinema litorale]|uniref:CheR family methyltransferase n=1 Tax=Chondrinema litorale TaxID=2994555 RepID=UPI002543787E|nr:protein-glutamate O-methyltransferase CheR [Chondrinema litorale]UZR99680.1 protein-glutamate O-methyltransferase CheR [Chondrinema litorale]
MIDISTGVKMKDSDFRRIKEYIENEVGIKLPYIKKTMIESRLNKRRNAVGVQTFSEYLDHVFAPGVGKVELINMIDAVTTNKTDFFREPEHFHFLTKQVLPSYADKNNLKYIKLWSAGCSTGEEAYTTCMVLDDYLKKTSSFHYNILATDISTEVLRKGMNAVYNMERVANIPLETKKRYLLKSKDKTKNTVRIIPELRKKVTFQQLNFMDDYYDISFKFDVVFCRNVLIYFNKPTQEKVIRKISRKIKTGGYLFLGHSETIIDMNLPLQQLGPTIFQKIDA